ncbi:methyl-accepting chemotaxis protein, partial [Halobacillus trueperi]|uniref:methyl-accepting chemotaxis protein n=1 Tax=Halobacillus trueperi TaxID=156205 RepID=UPI002161AAA8
MDKYNRNSTHLQAKKTMEQQKKTMEQFLQESVSMVEQSHELTASSRVIHSEIQLSSVKSKQGKEHLEEARKEMESIYDSSSELFLNINQLVELSQSLVQIIHNLKNISSQTNLLALNASIEAARAG